MSYHGPVHPWDGPSQADNTVPKSLVPREQELAPMWQGSNLATVRKEQHSGKGTNLATIVQGFRIGNHADPTNIPVRKQPRFHVYQYHQPTKRTETA